MEKMNKSTKSFENYMRCWNGALSLLGMSPVCMRDEDGGEVYFKVSVLRLAVSVLVIALSVFLLYLQVYNMELESVVLDTKVLVGFLNLTGNVVTCVNVADTIRLSKKYASLASQFLQFNKILNARVRIILLMSFKFVIFFFFVLLASVCLDLAIYRINSSTITIAFLINYFFEVYNLLFVCHYAVCCFWLREYLVDINDEVNRAFYVGSRSASESEKMGTSHWRRYFQVREKVAVLRSHRRLYHDIYLLSLTVNDLFSTKNIVIVAYNILLGTLYFYCGIRESMKYASGKPFLTTMVLPNYFKWSVISFVSIYGLVWPSNKVYLEVGKLTSTIESYCAMAPSEEFKLELHSFILQLIQEKIIFSPHGFFILDNGLLLSILGAVTSYLVVLLQF